MKKAHKRLPLNSASSMIVNSYHYDSQKRETVAEETVVFIVVSRSFSCRNNAVVMELVEVAIS